MQHFSVSLDEDKSSLLAPFSRKGVEESGKPPLIFKPGTWLGSSPFTTSHRMSSHFCWGWWWRCCHPVRPARTDWAQKHWEWESGNQDVSLWSEVWSGALTFEHVSFCWRTILTVSWEIFVWKNAWKCKRYIAFHAVSCLAQWFAFQ